MKREFKKGDRVLVRNNDLEKWEAGIFINKYNDKFHPFSVCSEEGHTTFVWTQCRHIDDFRTGDKVQVRSSMAYEWEDAVYGCYVPHDSFEHWVYSENEDDLTCHKLCRWHPSAPWANKKPLTLEQCVLGEAYDYNATTETHLPMMANARLMAAAPELFEVLEELHNATLVMEQPRLYKALAEAKKLIEKIEGDE